MFRGLLILALFLTAPLPCLAGAWPREKGKTFVATGYAIRDPKAGGGLQDEQNLYLEHGLTSKFTLGFSGSYAAQSGGEGHVFLRMPVPNKDRAAVLALEFGLGVTSTDLSTFDPFLKTAFSWGKGLTLNDKNGWMNVDTAVLWDLENQDHRLKLDATIGLNLSERIKVMGQGFIEIRDNSQSLTLMPSLVIGTKSGKTQFVLGVETKTGSNPHTGLRFGLWTTF